MATATTSTPLDRPLPYVRLSLPEATGQGTVWRVTLRDGRQVYEAVLSRQAHADGPDTRHLTWLREPPADCKVAWTNLVWELWAAQGREACSSGRADAGRWGRVRRMIMW